VLAPVAKPLEIDSTKKPFVILVVGVNGSGKTTTIGKLASKFSAEGRKVMLAAGDTFRAAAIEQLKVWGERNKVPVVAGAQGSDSASLAFNALTAAKEQGIDVLLIDTAGRLQNKSELMNELEKVGACHQEGRHVSAARGAARARCHGGTKCAVASRGVSSYRGGHGPRDDQARRHGARRHPGGAGREAQTAGAFHRRRRGDRRSRAVHRAGFAKAIAAAIENKVT
jgi:adenylate kinase family enzyme